LLVFYFILYLFICLIFKGSGYTNSYYVLVSVSTFLYGIFVGFSIYNHQTRLKEIRELLRTDDSCLLSIYRQSAVFGDNVQDEVRNRIDAYLIVQVDYKIADDFHESSNAFHYLYTYILELKPSSDKQVSIYESMLGILGSSANNRKLVGALVRQKVTRLEWASVLSLNLLIALILFIFHDNTLLSSLITSIIVVSSFIMIVVLYELNSLTWQEKEWIWIPLYNLFLDLGLLPYYPEPAIDQGRAFIPKGSKIRVCRYNRPYPDMSAKEIHIVTWE
jgi:hypothetical protein